MKLTRETTIYILLILFALGGVVGLLLGLDIMAGLGGLGTLVFMWLAQSPLKKKEKTPKAPDVVKIVAWFALGASLLLPGCGVFVHEVSCPNDQAPSAVIVPAPAGVAADGMAVARCGATEVERWTCEVRAVVECEPNRTSVLCVGRDGHERRMTVVDPNGVLCEKGGSR